MKFIALKFGLIFLLMIPLRIIELCREVIQGPRRLPDISVLYRILYLHLPMSMASIGLMCDKFDHGSNGNPISYSLLTIFILTILGCISRGIISNRQPEVFSLFDADWAFGIIVPNTLGLSALIFALVT